MYVLLVGQTHTPISLSAQALRCPTLLQKVFWASVVPVLSGLSPVCGRKVYLCTYYVCYVHTSSEGYYVLSGYRYTRRLVRASKVVYCTLLYAHVVLLYFH